MFFLNDYSKLKHSELNPLLELLCFEKILKFKGVSSLEGYDELKLDKAATDSSGEKDYGHIEEFKFTKLGDYYFEVELAGSLKFNEKEVNFVLTNI